MTDQSGTVTVEVSGGPTVSVDWTDGMNAETALERARNKIPAPAKLDFALQYFGRDLGYLVVMINGTFESFQPASAPNFYWDFLVNDRPAEKGIDGTVLQPGDKITFKFERYVPETHENTLLGVKYRTSFQ
jgi:hypothetical protein